MIDGGKVKAELRDVGDSGARALQRIEEASRPASRALQVLDGVAGELRGGLEEMANRAGPLGAGLARIGPAGLAAAAAIGAVTLGLKGSLEEAAKADQSYRRLEAVLKATGHASGLTADEIASFADGIERSTLATAEGVQDAASILATFRSVSGDTFTRALSLAQDMSAVFGQDLSGAATQLGKALEDPIDGLTALRRVGISFSDSQKELIRSLVETGQTAEAQRVILDALEQQVGGAGAAEAGGLTGATNRLQDAWGNLLEAIGRTPAVTSIAQGALDLLSGAIEGITSTIDDDPIGERIAAETEQLKQARDELARLEAGGPGTPMVGQRFALDEQRQRVAALEQELATLTRIGEAEAQAAVDERARAEAGQQAAESERRADALAAQRSQLDKALDQLATGPAERIAQVNRELTETKKRLDALRAPDGGNASNVDTAIQEAEEIARRRIAAINQPLEEAAKRAREAAERQSATEQAAAERVYQANEKVIDDLAKQLALFGDERRQFVDQALSRLSETATDEEWVQVERLANALYDEKLAREQLAESLRAEQQLRQQGSRLTEQMRTPAEELAATLQQLDALMQAGAIDAETHGRAIGLDLRGYEQTRLVVRVGSPGGPVGAQLFWSFSLDGGATWAVTLATVTLDEANQTLWGPWQPIPAALRQTIAAQLALFGQGGDGSQQVRVLEVALDIRGVDQTSAARLLPSKITPAEIANPVETELRSFSPADVAAIAGTGSPGGSVPAFGTIAVAGQPNVFANAASATLTLAGANGIAVTTDPATDMVTFAPTYGTTVNTVCEGNDARLADARTPTAHTHGAADLTDEGDFYGRARGTGLSDTGGSIAVAYGATGTTACAGNDSRLSDARAPTAHAASHRSGGGDAIRLDELASPTDVATLNASASAHGLLPKLDGNGAHFLDGTGGWSAPPYDILCGIVGKPANAEVVLLFVAPRAFRIPANAVGSRLKAGTAATGTSVFSIQKNGSEFLTATVPALGTTATFACSQTDFAAGDVLRMVAPASADASLADIALTLAATLL